MPPFLIIKTNAEIVTKALKKIRDESPEYLRQKLIDAGAEVLKRMQVPGRKPRYPIKWASDKQRKYVMAMLRASNNIPYKRTGSYVKGWKMIEVKHGVLVGHPWRNARFLSGDAQGRGVSSIHAGRWPKLRRAYDIVSKKLPKFMKDNLDTWVNDIVVRANNDSNL